jgi:Stress responsive A/B Barrel Domain
VLEHYVVFKARDGHAESLSNALAEFAAGIKETLPCLLEFSWGPNTNPSGLARGYTHGCLARLTTAESLTEEYWVHPAHQRLLAVLDDLCDDRFALDYVPEDATPEGAAR